MRRIVLLSCLLAAAFVSQAQKIESIHFNLYTDSLKKGFYNYINVDGKTSDGNWMPLDSTHILLSSNAGGFRGNDIFIDSSYQGDSIVVNACLRKDRSISRSITIYIKKRGFDEPLRSEQEILDELRHGRRNKSMLTFFSRLPGILPGRYL